MDPLNGAEEGGGGGAGPGPGSGGTGGGGRSVVWDVLMGVGAALAAVALLVSADGWLQGRHEAEGAALRGRRVQAGRVEALKWRELVPQTAANTHLEEAEPVEAPAQPPHAPMVTVPAEALGPAAAEGDPRRPIPQLFAGAPGEVVAKLDPKAGFAQLPADAPRSTRGGAPVPAGKLVPMLSTFLFDGDRGIGWKKGRWLAPGWWREGDVAGRQTRAVQYNECVRGSSKSSHSCFEKLNPSARHEKYLLYEPSIAGDWSFGALEGRMEQFKDAWVDGLEAQDRRVWLVGDSSMHQLSSAFLCLFHKRHQRSYRPTLRTARLSARKGGDLGSWLKKNGDKLLRDGDVLVLNAGVEYNALNLYQRDLKAAFRILKNISDFKPGLKLVWKDAVGQHFA